MKNFFMFLFVLILPFSSFASDYFSGSIDQQDSWALGIGFGTEAGFDSVTAFDLKSPRLFGFGHSNVSLVLSAEAKETSNFGKGVTPIHLLFDLSYNPYKEVVKGYMRMGGGMVFVEDKTIHTDSGFFNLQLQFGVELITVKIESGSYGTFFAQTMLNFPAIRNPPLSGLNIFDGTGIILGVRSYF